jgi:hypothetical protein
MNLSKGKVRKQFPVDPFGHRGMQTLGNRPKGKLTGPWGKRKEVTPDFKKRTEK